MWMLLEQNDLGVFVADAFRINQVDLGARDDLVEFLEHALKSLGDVPALVTVSLDEVADKFFCFLVFTCVEQFDSLLFHHLVLVEHAVFVRRPDSLEHVEVAIFVSASHAIEHIEAPPGRLDVIGIFTNGKLFRNFGAK